MGPEARKVFDTGLLAIAREPYGCGSAEVGESHDRREATVAGVAFVRYEVSASVVTVTVLRVVPAP
ncbi:hypothetical protein ABT354_22975 [Streptomyces sp. NPDC000594]|uniref:hypothetical protein n=1 Tax=Streptomyces sp. NPDC000594 TaxID=3154261 RepID=UPI0033238534